MAMLLEIDVIKDVVLLLNPAGEVLDAFQAIGKTLYQVDLPITHYTLRNFVSPPGICAVCGATLDEIDKPCSSSGGYHAFVGMADNPDLDDRHKAEHRNLPLRRINYEDLVFFVEPDHFYPIDQIAKPMVV